MATHFITESDIETFMEEEPTTPEALIVLTDEDIVEARSVVAQMNARHRPQWMVQLEESLNAADHVGPGWAGRTAR